MAGEMIAALTPADQPPVQLRLQQKATAQVEWRDLKCRANIRYPSRVDEDGSVFFIRDVHVLGPDREDRAHAFADLTTLKLASRPGGLMGLTAAAKLLWATATGLHNLRGREAWDNHDSLQVEVELGPLGQRRARAVRDEFRGRWLPSRASAELEMYA